MCTTTTFCWKIYITDRVDIQTHAKLKVANTSQDSVSLNENSVSEVYYSVFCHHGAFLPTTLQPLVNSSTEKPTSHELLSFFPPYNAFM